MPEFNRTKAFDRAVAKQDGTVRELIRVALKLLLQDPPAAHLHFKRLKGGSIYWSARVDGNYRIVLTQGQNGEFNLIDVCRHTVYDRKYC